MEHDPKTKNKTKEEIKKHTEDQANEWYRKWVEALSDQEQKDEREEKLRTCDKAEQNALHKLANLHEGGKLHRHYNLEAYTYEILLSVSKFWENKEYRRYRPLSLALFTLEDFEKLINAVLKLANQAVYRSDEDFARDDDAQCQRLQRDIDKLKLVLKAQIEIYREYFAERCPVIDVRH